MQLCALSPALGKRREDRSSHSFNRVPENSAANDWAMMRSRKHQRIQSRSPSRRRGVLIANAAQAMKLVHAIKFFAEPALGHEDLDHERKLAADRLR
jgi:hypothetical protein